MQRVTYIKEILRQHLQDGKGTYCQNDETATHKIEYKMREEMLDITRGRLSITERKYFTRKYQAFFPKPRDCLFYGMAKVHKDKIPVPLRPVVSQCGSLSAIVSVFLDYKL